ncbi:hypothetical protein C0Q70_01075 [Pomacea canaliculata]|uniref:LRRNT domain-containing protein n=1 Tax=Pomacea canaliculata TaxID=400727 RepID=A0A2T7PYI2_POMCA|nr:hypothetical protein C0Q70_01075 [Pomacea canaliculata]
MDAVHTGRDVLVFLLYEDIPSHELPRHVLYNLQSSTYMLRKILVVHESQMSSKMQTVIRLAIMLLTFGRTSSLALHDACTICSCTGGAVNCSYRNLHQVPNGLPPSAVNLNLSHNLLSNLSDNVFHHLTSLSVLDLSYNYLSSFTPSVFAGLRNLQWLSVTWNNLPLSDETYPFGVFSPFSQSLLYLYLNGNSPPNQSQSLNVSYPDKALSELLNLTELFMDGLNGKEFGPGFGHLQNLKKLSLSGSHDGFCDIEILYNDTFKHHPPALEYLNLSYCNIRCIEADAFSPLRTLQILDLSHNEDLGFKRLGLAVYGLQGSALHTLHINHINSHYALCVSITKEDTVYFKNTCIISIYANYNGLQFFFQGALLNMPDSLEFVSLDGNHLGFGKYLEDLNKLKSLKQIHADGYNIP